MIEFLFEACVAEIGVVVETDKPEKALAKLLRIRADNPSKFKHLKIMLSPKNPKGEIWIMKVDPHAKA